MKKSRKAAATVLAMTMVAGLAIIGCSGRGGSNEADGAPAEQSKETGGGGTNSSKDDTAKADDGVLCPTFYYLVNVGGSTAQLTEKICADFNTKNPNILVEPVYTGNYDDTVTKTRIAMQGGMPPDVFVSLATQRFTMASAGMAMPLGKLIETDGREGRAYIDDFLPGFMEDSYVGGKVYSIPLQRSTMALYYNKDAFKEAGLDPETPPATWEELTEYGQKLTDDGRYDIGITLNSGPAQWAFTGFCLQNSTDGWGLISEDGKSMYFSTSESVEALQFWPDLQNGYRCMAGDIVQWIDLPTQFLAEEVAVIYHTTGDMANIHDNTNFDFGTTPLPAHKRVGVPTGGGNLYISSGISENRVQAAWKFVRFTTSMDRAAQWSLDTGYVVIRQSCFGTDLIKDYYTKVPQASVVYEQPPYAKPGLTTYNAVEIWRVLNDNTQAAVVSDMSARGVLGVVREQAEEVPPECQ